jgi:transcriptional regulator with XRE-family HTH domain
MKQDNQDHTLGAALRAGRQRAGLSMRQLEAQAGVPRTTILRLENDELASPNPTALQHLARVLELPSSDLFLLAGIPVPSDRPSLPAMLRSDYDLPPEAVEEVQRSIERIARKYRKRPSQSEGI